MNSNYKTHFNKKKAFTLIELLIVIAIIGILFIVLVSKVDFATDKAKAVGVQTDFRSFQLALEMVSKEKSGFNSLGWNTGDDNANGVRDSVDEGDTNKDGVYQDGETWTGRKKYLETWTNTYSLIRPGTTFETDGYDKDAIFALETAINRHLDPKLHITINAKTGLITMANGAQDPWDTQYHGAYISAEDGMDRGAIVMYSNGVNQKFGSEHSIANGVPTVIVPGNNKDGQDDYSIVVVYTYTNGYGETMSPTWGFTPDNKPLTGSGGMIGGGIGGGANPTPTPTPDPTPTPTPTPAPTPTPTTLAGLYETGSNYSVQIKAWDVLVTEGLLTVTDGTVSITDEGRTAIAGDLYFPDDSSVVAIGAFGSSNSLTGVYIPGTIKTIGDSAFATCNSLVNVHMEEGVQSIGWSAFWRSPNIVEAVIPNSVTSMGQAAFGQIAGLKRVVIGSGLEELPSRAFYQSHSIEEIVYGPNLKVIGEDAFESIMTSISIVIPDTVETIKRGAFSKCYTTTVVISDSVTTIANGAFNSCTQLVSITIGKNVTSIEANAFNGCRSVETIIFNGTVSQWHNISKGSLWNSSIPSSVVVQCTDGTTSM